MDNLVNIVIQSQNYLRDEEGLTLSDAFDEIIKVLYTQFILNEEFFNININEFKKYFRNELYSPNLFNSDEIKIKDHSIKTLLKITSDIDFSREDIKGRLFEIYLGKTFTGNLGQFFTPRNVVKFISKMLLKHVDSNKKIKIIDPTCGSGGMLTTLYNLSDNIGEAVGIDIDSRLVRISNLNCVINKIKNFNIIHNSFLMIDLDNDFDIAISNPPFGSKVTRPDILNKFELGKGKKSQDLELLILEKIIKSLKPGGMCGIVLPMGVFNNKSTKGVRNFVLEKTNIICSVGLPNGVFKSSGTGCETSLLFFKKNPTERTSCKMYVSETVGYETKTKFAKSIQNNDLERIINDKIEYVNINPKELVKRMDAKYFIQRKKNEDNKFTHKINKYYDLINTSKYELENFLNNRNYVKYIQYSDVDDMFGFIRSSTIYNNFEILPGRARQIVKMGDVIVPRLSANKVGIIDKESNDSIVSSGFFVIRPKEEYSTEFIFSLFKSKIIKEQLNSISSGTIMSSVDNEYLSELVFFNITDKEIRDREHKIFQAFNYVKLASELLNGK